MDRATLESLDHASLVELCLRQAQLIAAYEARLSALTERLEDLERRSVRGAAPFARSEDKRSSNPRRPGRKGGHEGSYRVRPADDEIDQRIEVPLDNCPHCGTVLCQETDKVLEQTIIETLPVRPQALRLVTHRNRCTGCGRRVASQHPLQVSTASGAAGTHLGPRALAFAGSLSKGFGLTMRKSCAVLRDLLGISLSPGGLSQALDRMAERLKDEDAKVLEALKAEPVLYTDETSWWVGRTGFSLWVLTNQAGTCYRIVSSRSRAEAEALLGDYQGVLVSDCLNIYDDLTPVQHKCYAHHLKAISKAQETVGVTSSPYLQELRALLQGAIALKAEMTNLPPQMIKAMRDALETNAERLLRPPRTGEDVDRCRVEEKIRRRLLKQRDHLFTFLDYPQVDATNNRAERELRPAVVSRKLSCGNKTDSGAQTWQVLSSLAATSRQAGTAFHDFLAPRLVLARQ